MQLENKIGRKPGILKQWMGWANSLFGRTRGVIMGLWSREVMVDINAEKAITEGFNGNTAVYSIIMKDVNKFASIPRYLLDAKEFDKKNKGVFKLKAYSDTVKISNSLSKLLEHPNPNQGQAAFMKQVRGYYKTCGEAFIELNRGDVNGLSDQQIETKEIFEMYALPSNKVKLLPDPEDVWGIVGYKLNMGGTERFIHKKNIIHWKDVNLSWDAVTREHLRGMTALKPGEETLTANQDGERATVRMQQNDGAKGAVYGKEKVNLNAVQESQLRGAIDGKVNNADVKGSVASIFGVGELGYINFGGTSVDMQLLQAKDQSWKYLCALLDVPYLLFDPNATFANLESAKKNWLNDSIIPASKEFDDELNRVLLRAFNVEGIAIIVSDYTELPELQADMKLLTEWMNQSDEITPNERRKAKGYEERVEPEFDEPWMKTGSQPLSRILDDGGFSDLLSNIGVKPTNGKLNGQEKKPEAIKN